VTAAYVQLHHRPPRAVSSLARRISSFYAQSHTVRVVGPVIVANQCLICSNRSKLVVPSVEVPRVQLQGVQHRERREIKGGSERVMGIPLIPNQLRNLKERYAAGGGYITPQSSLKLLCYIHSFTARRPP